MYHETKPNSRKNIPIPWMIWDMMIWPSHPSLCISALKKSPQRPTLGKTTPQFGPRARTRSGPKVHVALPRWQKHLERNSSENTACWHRENCKKGIYPPGNGYISLLGKRKIIFKMPFLEDMLVSWRVYPINTYYVRCIWGWLGIGFFPFLKGSLGGV